MTGTTMDKIGILMGKLEPCTGGPVATYSRTLQEDISCVRGVTQPLVFSRTLQLIIAANQHLKGRPLGLEKASLRTYAV